MVALVGAALASYHGAFGPTGADYFQSCWERQAEERTMKGLFERPEPKSPQQAISWAGCEPISRRAIYRKGIILVGNPRDADDIALERVCPSAYRQVPIGGTYMLTLELLEMSGGPRFYDRVLPAEFMIGRVWEDKWPACSKAREGQGYPRIVEKSAGVFDWERRCARCN
ncbi:MAG: hypothetical protein JW395_1727 [Nitrospira sp.]|nr:hypothetical protein [Nitrospira sp.]